MKYTAEGKRQPVGNSPDRRPRYWLLLLIPLAGLLVLFLARGSLGLPRLVNTAPRTAQVLEWLRGRGSREVGLVQARQYCGEAPFLMPTEGLIGFIWDDSFYPGHRHQGLDIFGGADSGVTPVYAAFDGYLTREDTWKSSLIIRLPQDPLEPTRQIWTYYTHMADAQGEVSYIVPEFPPGTDEVFVPAGTLLGYQGNYSGDPDNPVGVHLHFSIVLDDGQGDYLNELEIANTLDPSPYLGLLLNANSNRETVPICPEGQRTPAP
jgi:hypothetical protein